MKVYKRTYSAPEIEVIHYELSSVIMDATRIIGTGEDFEGDEDWVNRMAWNEYEEDCQ